MKTGEVVIKSALGRDDLKINPALLRREAAQGRREDFARYLNAVPDGPDDSDKT
jgi:hypothetical protein